MKKYWSFFRIRFINGLQYRTAAYAGIATQFFWGIMLILMYRAFYLANPEAFPMTFQQNATYIWLQQAFLTIFMTTGLDNELFELITTGNIAYEMIRPADLYNMWMVKQMANRMSKAVLRCIPILVFSALLPAPYGLALPADSLSFVMFLITMVLGFITMLAFQMLAYIVVFYTMSAAGVRMIMIMVTEFLTGAYVPYPFLPEKLQAFLSLTPFAAMQNLPLRVYSGNIAGAELVTQFQLQIFWLTALVLFGKLWMNRTLRRVIVQGG